MKGASESSLDVSRESGAGCGKGRKPKCGAIERDQKIRGRLGDREVVPFARSDAILIAFGLTALLCGACGRASIGAW